MTTLFLALALLILPPQSGPGDNAGTASQTHGIWLSWVASAQSTHADPGTVNVYRGTGTCASLPAFTLQTPAAAASGPWHDLTAVSGTTYCYQVTALIDGVESTTTSNTTQKTAP